MCKFTPFEKKGIWLCNFTKSEKSVPSVCCCAPITIILTKQFLRPFNELQWQNKVHAIETSLSVLLSGTHIFLPPFNIMSGRNMRLSLSNESLGRKCIGLWDTNFLWRNGLDSNIMDTNALDTLAIAYCILLRHCIHYICVGKLMRCFRSTQCCVIRKSTAPKCWHTNVKIIQSLHDEIPVKHNTSIDKLSITCDQI